MADSKTKPKHKTPHNFNKWTLWRFIYHSSHNLCGSFYSGAGGRGLMTPWSLVSLLPPHSSTVLCLQLADRTTEQMGTKDSTGGSTESRLYPYIGLHSTGQNPALWSQELSPSSVPRRKREMTWRITFQSPPQVSLPMHWMEKWMPTRRKEVEPMSGWYTVDRRSRTPTHTLKEFIVLIIRLGFRGPTAHCG